MDRGAVAGAHFHLLHPAVLGEVRGQNQVLIFDRRPWPGIGTASAFRRRRRAFRCSSLAATGAAAEHPWDRRRERRVHPSCQRVDLGLGERSVVAEMSVARIGEPGRHFARDHRSRIALAQGRVSRVSEERHGRDFARTVALLAMLLEDRKNVFVENRLRPAAERASEKAARLTSQRSNVLIAAFLGAEMEGLASHLLLDGSGRGDVSSTDRIFLQFASERDLIGRTRRALACRTRASSPPRRL